MVVKKIFETTSTRPYLVRALHEWCCDNGLTPYITVVVDATVQVPLEYVQDGEIVLNIGYDATTALNIGNEYIQFKGRFSGAVREIMVPIEQICAIFARESGQGMAFPVSEKSVLDSAAAKEQTPTLKVVSQSVSSRGIESSVGDVTNAVSSPFPKKGKPSLTRVK